MIDAEELARWEKAARKDNPSYWGSDTLVKVFDELRRVEAEAERQKAHAHLKEEQFADVVERMRRVEERNRKLEAELSTAVALLQQHMDADWDCSSDPGHSEWCAAKDATQNFLKEIGE